MSEDKIIVEQTEEKYKVADIIEEQENIAQKETVDIIDVGDVEVFTVDSDEAFGALGEPNEQLKHQLLNGRDAADQHPISAITGLRNELDDIESLKVVYSNKKNQANYYLWQDKNIKKEDRVGYFVSVCPNTEELKICSNTDDIFGVTVDNSGFIGGQDDVERDYQYGLVVCSGLVAVRCQLDVSGGDNVICNNYGYAKRSKSGYGYKVAEIQIINGVRHALISLNVPMNQIDGVMQEFTVLGTRLDDAETNIVSALNMANQAYNKANGMGGAIKQTQNDVENVLGKINDVDEIINNINSTTAIIQQRVENTEKLYNEAKTEFIDIRNESVSKANQAVSDVSELTKTLEPLLTWEDPDSGNTGAKYLTNYIKNGLSTKADIEAAERRTDELSNTVIRNAEETQNIISSIDKYSVGEWSQAYGLTFEQAKNILRDGMIYIPTKDHKEVYSELETNFSYGHYYTWTRISEELESYWIESPDNKVVCSSSKPNKNSNFEYWYIDSDNAPSGYNPYCLYIWSAEKEEWEQIADKSLNMNNRISSIISYKANEISEEIANARGDAASLKLRIDEVDTSFSLLASRVDNTYYSEKTTLNVYSKIADLPSSKVGDYCAIGVSSPYDVYRWDGSKYIKDNNFTYDGVYLHKVNVAGIIGSVNNDGDSSLKLVADKINFHGHQFNIVTEELVFTTGNLLMDAEGIKLYDRTDYPWGDYIVYEDIMALMRDADKDPIYYYIAYVSQEYPYWTSESGYVVFHYDGTEWVWEKDLDYDAKNDCIYNKTGSNSKIKIGLVNSGNYGIDIYDGAFRLFGSKYNSTLTNDDAAIYFNNNGDMYLSGEIRKYFNLPYRTHLTGNSIENIIWKDELFIGKRSSDSDFMNSNYIYNGVSYIHNTPILEDDQQLWSYQSTGCFLGLINEYNNVKRGYNVVSSGLVGFGDILVIKNIADAYKVSDGSISSDFSTVKIKATYSDETKLSPEIFMATNGEIVKITLKAGSPEITSANIYLDTHYVDFCDSTVVGSSSFATNSDRRLKNSVVSLSTKYSDFFDKLKPVTYKYNDGTSNRNHTGFIAQDVSQALDESDIDSQDFAGLVILNAGTEEERWTLRYEEFIALNTNEIQKLKNRVAELENQVATLIKE